MKPISLRPVVAVLVAVVAAGAVSGCGDDAPATPTPTPSVAKTRGVPGAATAEAFADFAARKSDSAPLADEVVLYVGGREAGVLDRGEALRPRSWRTCPPGEQSYSMVACPVSALATLASAQRRGDVLLTRARVPAVVGCNRAGRVEEVDAARVVVLRAPVQRQNCFEDFAVSLYLDEADQVVAVDHVISSP